MLKIRSHKAFYILYIILTLSENVRLYEDISNDNVPEAFDQGEYSIILSQNFQTFIDGSGITTDNVTGTDETPTSIVTSMTNTYNTNTEISTAVTTYVTTSASCNASYQFLWFDNRCLSISEARELAVSILRNSSYESNVTAQVLLIYFKLNINLIITPNINDTLSPDDINNIVNRLSDVTITEEPEHFVLATATHNGNNTIFGGFLIPGKYGGIISDGNKNDINDSSIIAAAHINDESINNTGEIKLFIMSKSTAYTNLYTNENVTLASSIIVADVTKPATITMINITLYFKISTLNTLSGNGDYKCAYLDTSKSTWDTSGCYTLRYEPQYQRYVCICNHLSTFALLRFYYENNDICFNETHSLSINRTCVIKDEAQQSVYPILIGENSDYNLTASALQIYIDSLTDSAISETSNKTISLSRIDELLSNLQNIQIERSAYTSYILSQPINQSAASIVVGASYKAISGGKLVFKNDSNITIESNFTAAAIITLETLKNTDTLNMLFINNPAVYKHADKSQNSSLSSSVIVASVKPKSSYKNNTIKLYFQNFTNYQLDEDGIYLCALYDTNNSKWNESFCTKPHFNKYFSRYECSCNHLSTFALIWRPNRPFERYLTSQDIASLLFQSISIVCFIAVIVHTFISRTKDRLGLTARDLLPLISSLCTTVLFIFYIALTMTVYTQTSNPSAKPKGCFTSANVLMFFVYFFLIFMFCAKTSVGYFNYMRFVLLFPEPSYQTLYITLIISFFISITWTSFAAGFNSNTSFKITQLYQNRICWFTSNVIHYFLTIPACIFLLLNLIIIVFVSKRIIDHTRHATTRHQTFQRMKQCIIVLTTSSILQGIGWIFGPVIALINSSSSQVFEWIFILFNGLEGLWVILLYIIIRAQHMNEPKRMVFFKNVLKKPSSTSVKTERKRKSSTIASFLEVTNNSAQTKSSSTQSVIFMKYNRH